LLLFERARGGELCRLRLALLCLALPLKFTLRFCLLYLKFFISGSCSFELLVVTFLELLLLLKRLIYLLARSSFSDLTRTPKYCAAVILLALLQV
jgi:hypothetical protein